MDGFDIDDYKPDIFDKIGDIEEDQNYLKDTMSHSKERQLTFAK